VPEVSQAGHRFFTPEAIERIIEAAQGFSGCLIDLRTLRLEKFE